MNFKTIRLIAYFLLIAQISYSQESTSFVDQLHDYLHQLEDQGEFHLNILLAKDDEIILEEAFGIANRNDNIPNQLDTRFNMASIGKLFTATALLHLKEKGLVDFNATVGTYLPNFPNSAIRDSVYLYQLLYHTSGLNVFFSKEFVNGSKYQYKQLADFLPLYEDLKLEFHPGTKFSYSNPGYIILGMIIESVSGTSYANYVRKYIFRPANMQNTDNYLLNDIIPDVAIGYIRPQSMEDPWRTNAHINMGGNSAGGGYTTVGDLYKFSQALFGGKLINPQMVQQMVLPGINRSGSEQYGYGIYIETINGHKTLGHDGAFHGIRGELTVYTDQGYTVAILANSDQTDHIDVSYFIKTHLTGTESEKTVYLSTQELISQFQELGLDKTEVPENFIPDPVLMEIKAYHLLNSGNISKGINLLKLSARCFPEDLTSYINLAKAYLKIGNKKMAIENMEKAVELSPDNPALIYQLDLLKE